MTHGDRIDIKLHHLHKAVLLLDEILEAERPEKILSSLAKECIPLQHSSRYTEQFYSYLLFGRHGLHFNISDIGRWDRGAPDKLHARQQRSCANPEWIKKVVQGYNRFQRLGVHLSDIYLSVMRAEFGCTSRTAQGMTTVVHPARAPFPTENQFKRILFTHVGRDAIRLAKLGPRRMREEKRVSEGSFGEHVANACERVDFDPCHAAARPTSDFSGEQMPVVITARHRDTATGQVIGISFDLGGETEILRNCSLFCAAIDKEKFCWLFGVRLQPGQWTSKGVPAKEIMDRGPAAASFHRHKEAGMAGPDLNEMPPAYSGVSKAIVETAHPKVPTNKEGPAVIVSGLNVGQYIKQEIMRVISDNNTLDLSNRIPLRWAGDLEIHVPTPEKIYTEFTRRGRDDARQIDFDDAVRMFLPKVKAKAYRDRIELLGRHYNCKLLVQAGFFKKIASGHPIEIMVHHLNGCSRCIWLEFRGRIHELELQLRLDAGEAERTLPLSEVQKAQVVIAKMKKNLKAHKQGVKLATQEAFKEDTGMEFDSVRRVPGRGRRRRDTVYEGRKRVEHVRGGRVK